MHSLPRESEKAGRATHPQPLSPVGDPNSEGVRQVTEVPVAGAQHPAGCIPVGTWSSARPHRTQGLDSGGRPRGPSAQAYSTPPPPCPTGHPGWNVSLLSSMSLPCFFSRREGSWKASLAWQKTPGPSCDSSLGGQSLEQHWSSALNPPGPPPPPLSPPTPDSSFPCASGEGSSFLFFLPDSDCSRTDSGQRTGAAFCGPERSQVSLGTQTALPPAAKREAAQSREKPALRFAL